MLNKRILVLMFLVVFLPLVGCFPAPSNQAPIITSLPITAVTVGETYVYDVEATDPNADTLAYSLSTKPTGMTINPATGLIKWTPKVKGNYAVFVKVSDGALDITQSFTIVVSEPSAPPPVNHAPIITSIPNLTSLTKIVYIYEVKATDPDSDVLTYSLTVKPDGMAIDSTTGIVSWIPSPDQIGSNPVTVKVSDGKKATSQSFTIAVEAVKVIRIEASPDKMTLLPAQTQPLTVTAYYNNGFTADVTLDCIYVSSDPGKVGVTALGLVEARKFGKVTITVTYTPNGDVFGDTVVVTVGLVHNVTQDIYYATIQAAITTAATNPYDVIEVSPGTYTEEVTVNVEGLTIKGENLNAIVNGGFNLWADNITIDGLTLKNGLSGKNTRGIFTRATTGGTWGSKGHQIINNEIFDATYAINIVACGTEPVNIVVDNNKIHDCRIAIMLEGYKTRITNNELYDNIKSGIEVEQSCNNVIRYNNIYNNGENGIRICSAATTGNVINFNNIYGNVDFGVLNDSTSSVDATNNWWGDASGPSGMGLGTGDAVSTHVDYIPWRTSQF